MNQSHPIQKSKAGVVALVVGERLGKKILVDQLSDEQEIALFQAALESGEKKPLELVYSLRSRQKSEEEEFGNYVEELLSQPFVRQEIVDHGVQWLKSKMKIEEYQRCESEATRVIAQYAFKIFEDDPSRVEYMLAGPSAKVKIKVFVLREQFQSDPIAA